MEKDLEKIMQRAIDLKRKSMSPTRARNFMINPARALYDLADEFSWYDEPESGKENALDFGTIVHTYAEGGNLNNLDDEVRARVTTLKGGLYAWGLRATKVGHAVKAYLDEIKGTKVYERELKLNLEDGLYFHGFADVINKQDDVVTVYDIKTIAGNDFDRWINFGYEPDRLETYKRQIAFYAYVLETKHAKLLFVKKSDKTPFIYEYELTESELEKAQYDVLADMEKALNMAKGHEEILAVNDGSEWAFNYFGGKINVNQTH